MTHLLLLCIVLFVIGVTVAIFHVGLELTRLRRHLEAQTLRMEQQDLRLEQVESAIGALLSCSCGLGDRLYRVQKQLDALFVRQDQIKLEEPGFFRFREAAKLMDHGVSLDEIAKSCGLSQGEAELLAHFRKFKTAA